MNDFDPDRILGNSQTGVVTLSELSEFDTMQETFTAVYEHRYGVPAPDASPLEMSQFLATMLDVN